MTVPRFDLKGSEDLRAMLAVLIWQGDRTGLVAAGMWDSQIQEEYLSKAQYLMESSYRNYLHPAENLDK